MWIIEKSDKKCIQHFKCVTASMFIVNEGIYAQDSSKCDYYSRCLQPVSSSLITVSLWPFSGLWLENRCPCWCWRCSASSARAGGQLMPSFWFGGVLFWPVRIAPCACIASASCGDPKRQQQNSGMHKVCYPLISLSSVKMLCTRVYSCALSNRC